MLEPAVEAVKDGGADRLTRCVANMSDKQAVTLIAVESLGQRTTGLSLQTCRRTDNGAEWAYEKTLELPGAAEEISRRCPG